jgi:Ca-activated chloride channel family protein
MNSNSPEDRLLDELLHEQSHGPDEAFLKQIELAVDAGPKIPAARRSYARLAIAASVGLAVGISFWSYLQNRHPQSLVANTGVKSSEETASEKARAALASQELAKDIRDQEDKVEEQRKVLATIARTKGISYNGQDSFYGPSEVEGDQAARGNLDQLAKNEVNEESIKRGLDAHDYGDAKRDFEADQQKLQEMKLRQIAEGSVGNGPGRETVFSLPSENAALAGINQPKPAATPSKAADFDKSSLASNGTDASKSNKPSVRTDALEAVKTGRGSGSGAGIGGERKMPGLPALPSDGVAPPTTRLGDVAGGFRPPVDPNRESTTGDRYGSFIDQPWKSPDRDPLSTFSIDVDTASYSNVRRMIQEGREIPRDAVRIEECINAFSYRYPQPKGDAPFAVSATLAVCPWAPEHQLVRVAIKGREIDTNKRPASNLVFLIDVSGSMQSPDKLPLLKQSMATLVEQLDERDRVAIVVYAGSEGVALPSTRLDAEGRATVLNSLAKLGAGGSTNGGAGIKRAYELAMKEKIEGGVNRVILATDGDFNVGVTGQQVVELVKDRAQGGVYLTVLGFGTGNLNDAMMDAITRDGNGNYFYIDSEREGNKVFAKNLSGTLVTIAKDVKIQVEFNPAKVGSYRLIGYSNRVLRNEDFANDKVDAGDIGAGHTVTAFYELKPPGAAAGTDGLKYQAASPKPATTTDEWLTVKLRHKHPEGDESRLIEFPLTGDALALDKTEADFQFATAAALFGMKLHGMEELKDLGWDKVLELAKPGLADDTSEDRAEFVGLVRKLAGVRERKIPQPAEVVPVDGQR